MRSINIKNIPNKLNIEELQLSLSNLDGNLEVVYSPNQNWVNNKGETYTTNEKLVVVRVPSNISDKQVEDVVSNHNPVEHNPFLKEKNPLADKIRELEDRIIVLENS